MERCVGVFVALSAAMTMTTTASAANPNHVINAAERTPFAFILNTPTGEIAHTSSSELIRIVADFLRRETSFSPMLIESDVVRSCQGQLTCLVLAARADYKRHALARSGGGLVPYREHVRRLRKEGVLYPRYLFILSNVTVPGRADRMSALLIDTDLALGFYHVADPTKPGWEEDVETQIATRAAPVETVREEITGTSEAHQFLERLLTQTYVPTFESSEHWRPYGTVDIVTDAAGLEIVVDGQTVGSTAVGTTRITSLTPGTRRIELENPEYLPFNTPVLVRRGETATVEPSVTLIPSKGRETARGVVMWSGAVLAASGTVLIVYALLRSIDAPRTVCFAGGSFGCGSRFQTFQYEPGAALDDVLAVNPGGVLVAPLGGALLGAGATFSLGVLLSEDEATPWWYALLGTAVGGAIYGLSAAVN